MATCPTCRTHYPDDVDSCAHDGARLVPDAAVAGGDQDLPPGTQVGEYRIENKIGEGGFGAVYRAVHPVIGKTAAIKVLSRQYSANPQFVSRFVAEARSVNQIRHRNIIDIFSFGAIEDGRQYYVMELLEGSTLDAYLRKRIRLTPAEALPILVKIARALDAAHAAGIAHRDLKPENVFLVFDEDNAIFPKLLDFGIAKLLGESASPSTHKTRTGMAMGTPLYMSPEQCRGKNIDHRTDIYSFGVMAHELLAGRPPFDAEDPLGVLFKHTSEEPPPLSTLVPGLSPALDAPLLRMLEKDPSRRPASLLEAIGALVDAAKGAGYDVPGNVRRTGDGFDSGNAVSFGNAVTKDAMATAKTEEVASTREVPVATAKSGSGRTDTSMQSSLPDAEPASKPAASNRRALIMAAAAACAVVVAAIAFWVGGAEPTVDVSNAPSAASSAPAAPVTTAAAPPPTVAPAPSAVEAKAAVEVAVQSTPNGAEIWSDGKLLGKAPGPVRLPRAPSAKLTFKAPGYQEQVMEVPTEMDTAITVSLKKVAPARTGAVKKGDLENPFQ